MLMSQVWIFVAVFFHTVYGEKTTVNATFRYDDYFDDLAYIDCGVTNKPASASIEITKISPVFVSQNALDNTGSYYFNKEDGYLLFLSVDEKCEGVYKCTLKEDGVDPENWLSSEVFFKYTAPPTVRLSSYSSYELDQGQEYQLECTAEGDPQPKVSWEKEKDVSFHVEGPLIHFPSISKSDEGIYSCVADNGITFPVKVETEIGILYTPPVLSTPEQTVKVNPDDARTTKLECLVKGWPRPKVTWWKNTPHGRKELTTDWNSTEWQKYYIDFIFEKVGRAVYEKDTSHILKCFSVILIDHLGAGDMGEYTCVATNRLGTDEQTIILK